MTLNLWIIEDNVGEVERDYLAPFEEFSKLQTNASFPKVNIVLLGLSAGASKAAHALERRSRGGSIKIDFYMPDIEVENDREWFLQKWRDRIQDHDVVLVDPSVCGLGWQYPSTKDAFLDVAFQVRSWKSSMYKNRVLTVSNVTKIPPQGLSADAYEFFSTSSIPKGTDMVNHYKRKLEPFLRLPIDWTLSLNDQGLKMLAPFVEELRAGPNRDAKFRNIGECAKWELLELLFPSPNGPLDMFESTKGGRHIPGAENRYYYKPLPDSDSPLYMSLIRRRILYGLRQLWLEYVPIPPQKEHEYERNYELWLEIVAAGYHWYAAEQGAVRSLINGLKEEAISLTPDKSIDLEAADLGFVGKNGLVNYAEFYFSERKIEEEDMKWTDSVRRQGTSPIIRYLNADIYFRYKGEFVQGRPKHRWEIRYIGNRQAPQHMASRADWNRWWEAAKVEDFTYIREGHVEKFHNQMASRGFFKNYIEMTIFRAPMIEEWDWWNSEKEVVKQAINSRLKGADNGDRFNPFDIIEQSERKADVAAMKRQAGRMKRRPRKR